MKKLVCSCQIIYPEVLYNMKTFRLCSLMILFDEDLKSNEEIKGKEIPLVEGLIINKEEAEKNWLLEAVLDPEWEEFFREYKEKEQPFMTEVTITKRTNDPATLVCDVKSVNQLENHISVHLEGVLVVKKEDLSDMLIKNLIEEGFEGKALYNEYRKRKKDRGRAIQGILTNAYEQVKEKGYYTSDTQK
ncbi:YwpF-like protein [Salipaludibacillus aurantiacus]|uniref:YwpF-like protein n=2 Tax=Salipaludibacillus aurantiacus TaxID=1601833 RepID=A0A1H9WDW9_9BACI|nr:YwpF-like protein [Salipaludibacillus aurantiacus]